MIKDLSHMFRVVCNCMSKQESSLQRPAVITVYSSWEDIRNGLDPGEVIHVGKQELPHPKKQGFERAAMTIRGWTSCSVYQDTRRFNSLRIYAYDNHYKVTLLRHNPDSGTTAAIEHALADSPVKTALAVSVGYGIYQTVR